jgi:hypothetical protein
VRPRLWPKKVLLLSAPSMTTLFRVPRWPAKLMSPARVSRVTPGVVRTKSMKLRPFTGRFETERSFTVEDCWVRAVSMRGASALTVTSSCAAATFKERSIERTEPMFSTRFGRRVVAKPWRAAVTS